MTNSLGYVLVYLCLYYDYFQMILKLEVTFVCPLVDHVRENVKIKASVCCYHVNTQTDTHTVVSVVLVINYDQYKYCLVQHAILARMQTDKISVVVQR